MAITTLEQVRIEISDKIITGMVGDGYTILSTPHVPDNEDGLDSIYIAWDDVDTTAIDGNTNWARIFISNITGSQASLGRAGGRMFEYNGLVTIQVFAPIGFGTRTTSKFADSFHSYFVGCKTENIWFKNVSVADVAQDGAWYQMNVVAEFQYDRII